MHRFPIVLWKGVNFQSDTIQSQSQNLDKDGAIRQSATDLAARAVTHAEIFLRV